MTITQYIVIIFLAFAFISCEKSSEKNEKAIRKYSIDTSLNKLETDSEQDTNQIESQSNDSSENEVVELKRDIFKEYYLPRKVKYHTIPCNSSFSFMKSSNLDSVLSYMNCVKNKQSQIKLLRRALLLSHYTLARKADSLKYLSNRDLLTMLSYVVNQDIPSEAIESKGPLFSTMYSKISVLVKQKASKALVLQYIKDSVFNYIYLSYSFQRPTKNILMLDYNAAGMAGSAEKRYFHKVGDAYKELNLDPIIKKVNKAMTKIAKEDSYADTDRFEGMFQWNKKKSLYEMQLFMHVRSGAMCCPPYVVRLLTKDFKTIESRSMQFATTEHFSDSTIKPIWKTIQ